MPRRRLVLLPALVSLACAALQVPQQTTAVATPTEPALPDLPNILLITTDDQAVSDMRWMPKTRRLIGDAGATFTDAVSPYPLCCPARATLLTGQLSHNHGVLTNIPPHGGYKPFVESGRSQQTLPTWLPPVYENMFVGKFLNGYGSGDYRLEVPAGWDSWNGSTGAAYDYYNVSLNQDGQITKYAGQYQTDLFGAITRDHIAKSAQAGRPFFIWESNLAPHAGCTVVPEGGCRWGPPAAAEQDKDKFANLQIQQSQRQAFNERVVGDKPVHIRNTRPWHSGLIDSKTNTFRMRIRSLQAVDRSVAQTVQTLQDLGELDNTLIIFTSDNGYLLGQHRWHGKVLPYEPSLRIPLMMRGPGIAPGTTVSDTTALVDIAPTVAAAAGVAEETIPFDVDGKSLLPLAQQQAGATGYGTLSIEAGPQRFTGDSWLYRGVRTRRYTYVRYPGSREYELYDRLRDPHQLTNVAYRPSYRRTRAALHQKLKVLQDCTGSQCYQEGGGGVPRPEPEPYLDSGATVHPDDLGSIGTARQVVTVTARNWRSGKGQLTAWVRHRRTWTVKRGPLTVQLGSRGMVQEASRRMGTGETPAGTFGPDSALGLGAKPDTALRYRRVDQDDHWVFDPRVPQAYNINQPSRPKSASWRPRFAVRWAEHGGRFQRALVMRYNLPTGVHRPAGSQELRSTSAADVRKGSFIVHGGRRLDDHGWMSMNERQLTWLLRWMRPGTHRTTFVVGPTRYLRSRL